MLSEEEKVICRRVDNMKGFLVDMRDARELIAIIDRLLAENGELRGGNSHYGQVIDNLQSQLSLALAENGELKGKIAQGQQFAQAINSMREENCLKINALQSHPLPVSREELAKEIHNSWDIEYLAHQPCEDIAINILSKFVVTRW